MQSAVSELPESIEEHLRARREELCRSTQELLVSVEEPLERHRKLRAPRNENFNVFRLLDLECSEEELHSPFIAELLDPHGSHDLGTTFLQLFLNEVGEQVGPPERPASEAPRRSRGGTRPPGASGSGSLQVQHQPEAGFHLRHESPRNHPDLLLEQILVHGPELRHVGNGISR